MTTTARSIPAQVRLAFGPGNRLGSFLALYFGGLVPLTVWWVTHRELDPNQPVWNQPLTVIVLAGLAFSAVKVAKWARVAFGNWVEAVGFVVLMEGTMTYARTEWLSITVLVGLVFINAVSTACSLADEEAQTRNQDDELQTDGLNLSSFKAVYKDEIQNVMPEKESSIPLVEGPAPGKVLETPIIFPARMKTLEQDDEGNLVTVAVETIPDRVVQATETAAQNMPLLKRTRRPRVR